jgi:hypothetical protein
VRRGYITMTKMTARMIDFNLFKYWHTSWRISSSATWWKRTFIYNLLSTELTDSFFSEGYFWLVERYLV